MGDGGKRWSAADCYAVQLEEFAAARRAVIDVVVGEESRGWGRRGQPPLARGGGGGAGADVFWGASQMLASLLQLRGAVIGAVLVEGLGSGCKASGASTFVGQGNAALPP